MCLPACLRYLPTCLSGAAAFLSAEQPLSVAACLPALALRAFPTPALNPKP